MQDRCHAGVLASSAGVQSAAARCATATYRLIAANALVQRLAVAVAVVVVRVADAVHGLHMLRRQLADLLDRQSLGVVSEAGIGAAAVRPAPARMTPRALACGGMGRTPRVSGWCVLAARARVVPRALTHAADRPRPCWTWVRRSSRAVRHCVTRLLACTAPSWLTRTAVRVARALAAVVPRSVADNSPSWLPAPPSGLRRHLLR